MRRCPAWTCVQNTFFYWLCCLRCAWRACREPVGLISNFSNLSERVRRSVNFYPQKKALWKAKRRKKKANELIINWKLSHKFKSKTTTPAHPTQLLLSCLPITHCKRTPNNAESIGTRLSASYAQIIGALPLSTHKSDNICSNLLPIPFLLPSTSFKKKQQSVCGCSTHPMPLRTRIMDAYSRTQSSIARPALVWCA